MARSRSRRRRRRAGRSRGRSRAIPIPPSTPFTLIFARSAAVKGFDTNSYTPELTDGKATKEEIDTFLKEIYAVTKPYNRMANCAFLIFILWIIFSMFGFMIGIVFLSLNNSNSIVWIVIVFVVLFLLSVFIFVFTTVHASKKSKQKAELVLNKNKERFSERGLRWVIPAHFPRWIELHKDYMMQGGNQGHFQIEIPSLAFQQQPMYGHQIPAQNLEMQQIYQVNYYANMNTNANTNPIEADKIILQV